LFIHSVPNCGNPQKVQRYLVEWRDALDWMRNQHPHYVFPGHGPPLQGAQECATMLGDTSDLLTGIFDQFVVLFNENRPINDIIHGIRVPEGLMAKKYLQPIYDEPEFLVRNLYRLYGGWYSGIPSELKPAPTAALATELVSLIPGGGILSIAA
jgi:alkyl sulfatase BDS1-like metallo-beta-lactamase superfamily hydrolase